MHARVCRQQPNSATVRTRAGRQGVVIYSHLNAGAIVPPRRRSSIVALADSGLSTPEVYAELDRHRERHASDIAPAPEQPAVEVEVLQALRAGDAHQLAEYLYNDLQAPALHLQPELAQTLEQGELQGALAGIVSGSGPTVAFLAADADAALELQVALSASRLTVLRATGPVHGARVVAG